MFMSSANAGHHHSSSHHRKEGGPVWLAAVAGLCASLVGLGLARFAYTPLIPALIAAKWFSPAEAVYLGAANLAGYLAGALIARELGARLGSVRTLRAMMVLAALSCFACSAPVSFVWFFGWRFRRVTGGGSWCSRLLTICRISRRKGGLVGMICRRGPRYRRVRTLAALAPLKVSGKAGTASDFCLRF
jgi:MFS family permease